MLFDLLYGVEDWKTELSLGQILGKTFIGRVIVAGQVGVIIPEVKVILALLVLG